MLTRIALPILFLCSNLLAQVAQTLALPDLLDLRPTAARLQARLGELAAEAALQTTLGNPGTAAQINAVIATLQAYQAGTTPLPPGGGLEFHLVSFYDGNGATSTTPGTANIEVDRPGTAVALVLNAYDPIAWTVTQTAGTTVIAVISYSYEDQTVTLVGMPAVPTVQLSFVTNNDGDYFGIPDDSTDPEGRFRANAWSLERLGAFPNTYTGDYSAPSGTFVVGDSNPQWRDQWVLDAAIREGGIWNVQTRSDLYASFQGAVFLPLFVPDASQPGTPTVALATPVQTLQPLVPLPPGTSCYSIDGSFGVYTLTGGTPSFLDLATLGTIPIPPNPLLPPLSFANTLTVDTVRNRVLVSSFVGSGELRAYDIANGTWSILANLNNQEPKALAYHPLYDATFGLLIDVYDPTPYSIAQYDSTGAVVGSVPLALPVFDQFLESHQLYPLGNGLAYVGPSRTIFGLPVRLSLVIDPLTGNVTYAGFLVG